MSGNLIETAEKTNKKILTMLSNINTELISVKKRQDIFFERQMGIEKTLKQIQEQQEIDKKELINKVLESSRSVMGSTDFSLEDIFGKEKFTDLTADLASAFTSLWGILDKIQNDIDVVKRHV